MSNPILLMASSPTCPAGWHVVPGASPPTGQAEALALVVPSLVPLDAGGLLGAGTLAGVEACLPPVGFVPKRTEARGDVVTVSTHAPHQEAFGRFWFSVHALHFARRHHPSIRWAPGGADGFGAVTEVDLLHGWVEGRCVAVVCRLAP